MTYVPYCFDFTNHHAVSVCVAVVLNYFSFLFFQFLWVLPCTLPEILTETVTVWRTFRQSDGMLAFGKHPPRPPKIQTKMEKCSGEFLGMHHKITIVYNLPWLIQYVRVCAHLMTCSYVYPHRMSMSWTSGCQLSGKSASTMSACFLPSIRGHIVGASGRVACRRSAKVNLPCLLPMLVCVLDSERSGKIQLSIEANCSFKCIQFWGPLALTYRKWIQYWHIVFVGIFAHVMLHMELPGEALSEQVCVCQKVVNTVLDTLAFLTSFLVWMISLRYIPKSAGSWDGFWTC